jgi:hypothetical protein
MKFAKWLFVIVCIKDAERARRQSANYFSASKLVKNLVAFALVFFVGNQVLLAQALQTQ